MVLNLVDLDWLKGNQLDIVNVHSYRYGTDESY